MIKQRMIVTPRPYMIPLHRTAPLGLSGRITVEKYGRDGKRKPVRIDRDRRAFQAVWEHEQTNLILNTGLDYALADTYGPQISTLHSHVGVGTGSIAPDVGQNALANEIARSSNHLNLGPTLEVTNPETGRLQFMRSRAFDFNQANGNLTEFGGSASSSASMNTRDLFRNEQGDPITITKTEEEQLVIHYSVFIDVAPTSMTPDGSINIAGFGTIDVEKIAYRGYGSSGPNVTGYSSSLRVVPVTALSTTHDSAANPSGPPGLNMTSSSTTGSSTEPYVGGSYERIWTQAYGAQTEGATIVGIVLIRPNSTNGLRHGLWGWNFTNPQELQKDADYRLIVSAKMTVARS